MSKTANSSGQWAEFTRLLAPSRKRVHRAVLRWHVGVGCERTLVALLFATGLVVASRIGFQLAGQPPPFGRGMLVGFVALSIVLPLGVAMGRGWRDVPTLRQAAERLDLAAGEHNRVAIGLALIERGANGPFGRAAIADGLDQLRRISAERPIDDLSAVRIRRIGWMTVAVAILGAFAWLGHVPAGGGPGGSTLVANGPRDAGETRKPGGDEQAKAAPRQESKATLRHPAAGTASGRAADQAEAPTWPPTTRTDARAAGRTAGGLTAGAHGSHQSAQAGGESAASAASPGQREQDRPRPAPPKPPKDAAVRGRRPEPGASPGSSMSQGASRGGSMSQTWNSWSQHERSVEGDQDDADADEYVEDEAEASRQRGGIQPSLKDRNESPTRELGISGEEGPPGSGRGGPTPPKKSRGTASLVLGVPIPDFVRGRIGPGTTKITQEQVAPTPMPGEPGGPVNVPPRDVSEGSIRRDEWPAAFAAIVRDYLVALHSMDAEVAAVSAESDAAPAE